MDFNLRKSFNKSHGSSPYRQQHMHKLSGGGGITTNDDSDHEERPILFDHNTMTSTSSAVDIPHHGHREVIVKIDAGDENTKIWGSSSGGDTEDPPSQFIGNFLNRQWENGDEMAIDMDLDNDEKRHNPPPPMLIDKPVASKELKVSFSPPVRSTVVEIEHDLAAENRTRKYHHGASHDSDEDERRRAEGKYKSPNSDPDHGEILKCTSNSTFQRKSTLLRAKTRSRLIDPPDQPDRKSGRVGKSGPLKSGMLGKAAAIDEEDEDPFKIEGDLPEEYKKANFSALTLAQWVSLVLIVGALICSLSVPKLKRKSLWKLHLWKWEVLVFVLICGRLISGWGIRIVVFFVERNFLLRKRVLYFVYGLRKAVQNCLWLGLVLIAWHFLFDKKVEREKNIKTLEYVTKILVCFLIATLLWLVKTLMVKVLASSFHVSTYFDRIQESLFNQFIIETLSGPPLIELQSSKEEMVRLQAELNDLQNAGAKMPPDLRAKSFVTAKSGRVIGNGGIPKIPPGKSIRLSRGLTKKQDDGITIDHLHKLNPKNISAWNMKRLMNIVRHGALSTLDEQIVGRTNEDESATQIRSEYEAKSAARKIFQNVAKPNSKYIYPDDLMRFMQEDEVMKTLSLFDGASEMRKISKSSLKNWVVNSFIERRALALTLNDTKTAVNKLHHMVNIIVGIIIVIIWLIVLEIATSKFLLLVSSQLVVAAFIFGNTLKTIFEALIFLFVIHPFDVGDRCEIDGVQMIVEEMNILTTVFLRADNQKLVYLNSLLATKSIGNYYRSPDMGDAVEFSVHIATPPEKIALMRQRILSYIENKKEHWYSTPMVILKDLEELSRLKFAVWLRHRINHQNMGERWQRRALLVEEMLKIFRDLDIEYRLYPLDINIRAMPQLSSARVPPY